MATDIDSEVVRIRDISLSQTMPGRVAFIGKLDEIELIDIFEKPGNEERFRWWIRVKVGLLVHECLVFNYEGRRFISVGILALPHLRKEFYLE